MSGFCYKHFLELLDFTPAELNSLLQLVAKLEADKKSGKGEAKLTGKNIMLIFEKDSTRTRCPFEAAAYDQDVHVAYLDPSGSQIGHKKSIKDTARVPGRMYDGIQYRGYGQETVETPAEYTSVPVWNGLINEPHPTQPLADPLTMQEHLLGKAFNRMMLIYAGDARDNMGNSMLEATALADLDLRLVALQACWSETTLVTECRALTQQNGGNITLTKDVMKGVEGADFIYTDVWVSMGEAKGKQTGRITLLREYQVNSKVMRLTGNPEARFLHCLLAFHDDQATFGKRVTEEFGLYDGTEVTDEAFESTASIVFDQAESCMYTIRAVVVAMFSKQLLSL